VLAAQVSADRLADVAFGKRGLDDAAPTTTSAWAGQRLEYQFGVSGMLDGKEVVLDAPEYPGGVLDWSAFNRDTDPGVSLMAGGLGPDSTPVTSTAMPTPAS
jgi:hypothetical protein